MDYLREVESKIAHDPFTQKTNNSSSKRVWVPGPVVVGGGPSGLAVAACLKERGVPSLILERSDCIASMWQHKTYNRLRLHLPKHFCELPLMPFPSHFPTYPNKQQFLTYLDDYARHFKLEPLFNRTVVSAELDHGYGSWKVKAVGPEKVGETEYVCQWLIVATGENADDFVPQIDGINEFSGPVFHTSAYKCGDPFRGKSVLVVGCGNSGMEVALDLCNFHSRPSLVVRNSVHVLPREMFGLSTFWISMWVLKWLPISLVDRLLLLMARLTIGDTARYGLHRPKLGPLQLKHKTGKTPVLDVGTLGKIKSGDIKVRQGIKRVTRQAVEFLDGKVENFDAIILATGYKSNVPTWLKENNLFSENGLPSQPFPNGWKGEDGLYAVGFTQRGLLGSSMDATRIAEDIENQWRADAKQFKAFTQAVVPLP